MKQRISGDPQGEYLWVEADVTVRLGVRWARYAGGEVLWYDAPMVTLTLAEWEAVRAEVVRQMGIGTVRADSINRNHE